MTTEQLRQEIEQGLDPAFPKSFKSVTRKAYIDAIMHAVKDHVVYVIGEDLPINEDMLFVLRAEKLAINATKAEQRNRAGGY